MSKRRTNLPLNALRAFEATARHQSFTRAARELGVTPAAVGQLVRSLEDRIGMDLFVRQRHRLILSPSAERLAPVVGQALDDIAAALDGAATDLRDGTVLRVGCVSTFAIGWLLPRLPHFEADHPTIRVELQLNANRRSDFDDATLDLTIRYGHGRWQGAELLLPTLLSPLCTPEVASRLKTPGDLASVRLLRTYHNDEWATWLRAAGVRFVTRFHHTFDSSIGMIQALFRTGDCAIASVNLFQFELARGLLAQPFPLCVPMPEQYWLVPRRTRGADPACMTFRQWLLRECAQQNHLVTSAKP